MSKEPNESKESADNGDRNRRDFLIKAAYVVPTVLSINVALVSARAGSHEMQMGGKGSSPERGARDGEREQRRTDREK